MDRYLKPISIEVIEYPTMLNDKQIYVQFNISDTEYYIETLKYNHQLIDLWDYLNSIFEMDDIFEIQEMQLKIKDRIYLLNMLNQVVLSVDIFAFMADMDFGRQLLSGPTYYNENVTLQ